MSTSLVSIWEDCMINNKDFVFSRKLLVDKNSDRELKYLLKYIFESVLEWKPETLENYATYELFKWLKLESVCECIKFPAGFSPKTHPYYIAHYLYSNSVNIDKNHVISIYCDYIDGNITKLPNGFFLGDTGLNNLNILCNYFVEQYLCDKTLKEIYDYFYNTPADFLIKTKLDKFYKKLYDSPLDLLHGGLDIKRSEFYYNYYKMLQSAKKVIK